MNPAPKPTDDEVKRFILIVLDDYLEHEWDDVITEVERGFRTVGQTVCLRQFERCLAFLVRSGELSETWSDPNGEWKSFRRISQPEPELCHPTLF